MVSACRCCPDRASAPATSASAGACDSLLGDQASDGLGLPVLPRSRQRTGNLRQYQSLGLFVGASDRSGGSLSLRGQTSACWCCPDRASALASSVSASACVCGSEMDAARASARMAWSSSTQTAGKLAGMLVLRSVSWSRWQASARALVRSGVFCVTTKSRAMRISAKAAASPPVKETYDHAALHLGRSQLCGGCFRCRSAVDSSRRASIPEYWAATPFPGRLRPTRATVSCSRPEGLIVLDNGQLLSAAPRGPGGRPQTIGLAPTACTTRESPSTHSV